VQATLGNGAGAARGIASALSSPGQVSVAVRHALPRGRYTLTLRYRGRRARQQITIR
jgi:hypothetical protein